VEIHEYAPSFLHAKVAVMDAWATATGPRWARPTSTRLSLLLAREANVVVDDAAFAMRLRERLLRAMPREGHAHGPCARLPAARCAQRVRERLALGLMRLALLVHGQASTLMGADLVVQRPEGLYCPPGGFYIDPWRPVDRAVITHAHADHARRGHGHYLAAAPAGGVLRARLGDITLQTLAYGERIVHHGVTVSLHPAGPCAGLGPGAARTWRPGLGGQGDYKVAPDRTCAPFEPVRCDVFITESTFGLPIYRWARRPRCLPPSTPGGRPTPAPAAPACCCATASARRSASWRRGRVHRPGRGARRRGAAERGLPRAGVALPATRLVQRVTDKADCSARWCCAPPAASLQGPWIKRFGDASDAFASGWMQLRGARRRGGTTAALC
jgi:putative mRNA 3-end processing factor